MRVGIVGSIVMIICSLFILFLNHIAKNDSPINYIFGCFFLVFGFYLFIQNKKERLHQPVQNKRKSMSLEIYSISCILVLSLLGIYYYKIKHDSLSIVIEVIIISALIVFFMALFFRKMGYLRSYLLKEYKEITNKSAESDDISDREK